MTDATPKPKLKRWRWLLVGLMLSALIGVVSSWGRRSIDQRFSGKWKYPNFNQPILLSENGTGVDSSGEKLKWWVEGETLVFDYETGAVARLTRAFEGFSSRRNHHQIVDIQPDRLELRLARDTSGKTFVFTRVK